MDSIKLHNDILNGNRVMLSENLKLEGAVIDAMYQQRLLHRGDITKNMTDREKFDFIMERRLLSGGPEAFDKFCTVLACDVYSWMAVRLKVDEVKKLLVGKRSDDTSAADVIHDAIGFRFLDRCRAEMRRRERECSNRCAKHIAGIVSDIRMESQSIALQGMSDMLDDVCRTSPTDLESLEKEELIMQRKHAEQCLKFIDTEMKRKKDSVTSLKSSMSEIFSDMTDKLKTLPDTNGYDQIVRSIYNSIKDFVQTAVLRSKLEAEVDSTRPGTSSTALGVDLSSRAGTDLSFLPGMTPFPQSQASMLPPVHPGPLVGQPQGWPVSSQDPQGHVVPLQSYQPPLRGYPVPQASGGYMYILVPQIPGSLSAQPAGTAVAPHSATVAQLTGGTYLHAPAAGPTWHGQTASTAVYQMTTPREGSSAQPAVSVHGEQPQVPGNRIPTGAGTSVSSGAGKQSSRADPSSKVVRGEGGNRSGQRSKPPTHAARGTTRKSDKRTSQSSRPK